MLPPEPSASVPAVTVVAPVKVFVPVSVSVPVVSVRPPVPLTTPEYVPVALLSVSVPVPSVTEPAPASVLMLELPAPGRWTSPSDSRIRIEGAFQHGSANGDGVRGRIVSDRRGPLGQWQVHNSTSETRVDEFIVQAGESIDFVTDCIANESSDSFMWKTKITVLGGEGLDGELIKDSVAEFHGPVAAETYNGLPSQLHYAWRLAYCRVPTQAEFKLSMVHVDEQLRAIQKDRRGVARGSSIAKQVLVNFCHALLNSSEFVYVD